MLNSKLRQAVATTVAALALLALAAPAAGAREPVAEPVQPPPADLIWPIGPVASIDPCICLPPPDVA